MIDEHSVSGLHVANCTDGLQICHTVPGRALVPLEVVERGSVWARKYSLGDCLADAELNSMGAMSGIVLQKQHAGADPYVTIDI